MSRRTPAYERIAALDELVSDVAKQLPATSTGQDTDSYLSLLRIKATLAVAQATVELQVELEGIRQSIANLR